MKKAAKVSVIVPVYKTQQYLRRCLDSIVGQTLRDIEIICVNDGSPDDSGRILEEYAARDKRIKILTQENQGLAAARNNGMKISAGEYVGFLDSDDMVSLDFYERLYNLAKKHDADISCGNVMIWKSDKNKRHGGWFITFNDVKAVRETSDERKEICFACACWNKIYRRDFIRKNGYVFPSGRLLEDFPFTFMTALSANKIAVDNGADYFYRQRPTSIMANIGAKGMIDKWENHKMMLRQIAEADWGKDKKAVALRIAEAFTLKDAFIHYANASEEEKNKIFLEYKKFVESTDWRGNEFLNDQMRRIVKAMPDFSNWREFAGIKIVRFFGIPLLTIKKYAGAKKISFLGIMIWQTRFKENKTIGRLFGFLPLWMRKDGRAHFCAEMPTLF